MALLLSHGSTPKRRPGLEVLESTTGCSLIKSPEYILKFSKNTIFKEHSVLEDSYTWSTPE